MDAAIFMAHKLALEPELLAPRALSVPNGDGDGSESTAPTTKKNSRATAASPTKAEPAKKPRATAASRPRAEPAKKKPRASERRAPGDDATAKSSRRKPAKP